MIFIKEIRKIKERRKGQKEWREGEKEEKERETDPTSQGFII